MGAGATDSRTARGGACTFNYECEGDAVCRPASGGGLVCADRGTRGQTCDSDGDCVNRHRCSPGSPFWSCRPIDCAGNAECLGETCWYNWQCPVDQKCRPYYIDESEYAWICQARGATAQDCDDDTDCRTGLECVLPPADATDLAAREGVGTCGTSTD